MAVRTLADGKLKVTLLTAAPTNLEAITLADLTAGIDASPSLAKNGTRFSATSSDTISDARLTDEGNANSLGPSNYEASLSVFLWYDATTGNYVALDNEVFEAVREKGTTLWAVTRESHKRATEDWAAAEDYEVWEIVTDNPQRPTETAGFVKRTVPLQVQNVTSGTVAGA